MHKRILVYAKVVLAAVGVVTIFFAVMASFLELDYDFEAFFPKDDPELAAYLEFREKFENDNDFMIIGIPTQGYIFDQNFLERLSACTDSIEQLPDIKWVQSITNARIPIIGPMAISQVPLIHSSSPERYYSDSILLFKEPGMVGNLIATDRSAVAIFLKHTDNIGKQEGVAMLENVQGVLNVFGFENARQAGKILAQETYIIKMRNELILFASTSILLVVLFLWFSFRSSWGVWVPVVIIIITVVWVLGIMKVTGAKLNIITTIMPTIMFVVGMSDVVHILSKYLDELRNGLGRFEALKKSIKEVGKATLFTSITTAVGFASLLTVSINPIKDFGVYTAVGVIVAFVIAYAALPAALLMIPKRKLLNIHIKKSFWTAYLHQAFRYLIYRRRLISLAYLSLAGSIILGIFLLKVNITLLDDIDDKDPLKQDFKFFEEKFSGVRPFEMSIEVVDSTKNLLSYEVLQELDKVDAYLAKEYGVQSSISPLHFVKGLYKATQGGSAEQYRLPEKETLERMNSKVELVSKQRMFKIVSADSLKLGRYSGRISDQGSYQSRIKNKAFYDFLEQEVNQDIVQFRLTGTALLLDNNNDHLVENMLKGLGIGFLITALIVFTIFSNIWIAIISLVVNIFPLAIVAGIMGYSGIPLQVGTSIIFTIAFGIAVDDTIHFLGRIKIELEKGKSMLYAIKRTFISTGKALMITSLILISGFLTLMFSSFNGTFYTGLLVSLTLVFALISDLILLPLLLLFFDYKNGKILFKTVKNKKKSVLMPTGAA